MSCIVLFTGSVRNCDGNSSEVVDNSEMTSSTCRGHSLRVQDSIKDFSVVLLEHKATLGDLDKSVAALTIIDDLEAEIEI
ncbi:hypothetical protein NPIL_74241 [Nephila pilipes]|uniref:Uncharacterized protein n=1 Tax=Nephila pilipes TaxID=299642 RepID=A0A8X6PTX5_NEPPI|nr:hypothetical protein NPIL_74241 [Nephila pilipes]